MLEPIVGYLDPGAGATILQLVLAGTVGIGALVKLRWQNIKNAVGRGDESAEDVDRASETAR